MILETERLRLRKLVNEDAEFIIRLVNTPEWLQYIGDKNIKSIEDAEDYLNNGPIKSYSENGYGLWIMILKETEESIGICGLVNRESLDDIDIGFALLPEYSKLGYAYEAAKATMDYAKDTLAIEKIVAITDQDNHTSIKLLNKLGLEFERNIEVGDKTTLLLSAK